ncbi:immunoglobulin superfamily member 6 isoform X2 [Xiphias gladius]|uniref:immunoglobulin superfamily member 6 isoform X2 n=1 Tax=Xiphias gladius TaxID=8245 RepID=UPI001A99DD1D|nr:immunoglobulin superfamily member 6 isoform X2 [Xiphias gladius]
MDRLFWFSLLFTHLPRTVFSGIAEGCLIQPEKEIWRTTEQDAVLTCTVSSHCPAGGWQYEWFVFKEHSHHHLNLSVSRSKYTLDGASLHISPLTVNDSGIYHCAAVHAGKPAKGAQHVGLGTTLAVTVRATPQYILLYLSFILLVIYSITVLTLIILKEYGCNMSFCRRMCKIDKTYSTKKIQFGDVLQEMTNKRNLKTHKQTVGRHHSQVKAASNDFNNSPDDIYQNVYL